MVPYPEWITPLPLNRNWELVRGNTTARLCNITAIAIHYTAGDGQNARQIRHHFQTQASLPNKAKPDLIPIEQGSPVVGTHFVIDDNEILALAPSISYVFYHVGDEYSLAGNRSAWKKTRRDTFVRGVNFYTIGIEHCHPDASGKFTPAVLKKSHKLVNWIKKEFGASILIGRHYDFSGKACPIYMAPVLRGKNDDSGRLKPEFTQEMLEVQVKTIRWQNLLSYYKQGSADNIPAGLL